VSIFKVSQKAEDDLLEIAYYTDENWGKAQRNLYLDDINRRFHEIADNPNWPAARDINTISKGCFIALINKHIIVYKKYTYGI
jgi:toxin ParE1/3/4